MKSAAKFFKCKAMDSAQSWFSWLEGSGWFAAFILQFLPNVLIFVSMYIIIPSVLSYLSKFERHLTVSGEQTALLKMSTSTTSCLFTGLEASQLAMMGDATKLQAIFTLGLLFFYKVLPSKNDEFQPSILEGMQTFDNFVDGETDYRENDHSSIAAIDPPLSSAIPIAPPLDSLERSVLKSSVNLPLQASEHVGDGNACSARGKKPAWNLPSSSVSAEEGSVSPNSKLASSNTNLNPTSKPSPYSIHKPTKRGNTSGATYGGPAVPPPLTSSQMNQPLSEKQTLSETSPKVSPNKYTNNNDNWDRAHKVGAVATQSHGVNDQRSYGGSRRGNNGHHNSYVNRWDSERRGSEWNHRNFVRDVHMLQLHTPWGVQPYPRPPFATQLIAPPPPPPPPPLRPFNNNFGFLDFSPAVYHVPALPNHYPEPVRGVSFSPHPAPAPVMFYPTSDQQRTMLLKQIEYYFSPENLCKDTYLRQNMDEQGWVPISLIAGFNRVKRLTNNIQFIIDTMQPSM
ncbi:hypothetical protein HPP92_014568 [Vanilla planifolia]|uniref:HTH La-type RNA-binding domain-containing protein n=1 Tax=Vanilla planifolia TaxID=51239 RepID=A0A835QW31_VANPL|nr:hypothetical protein HPP92_014568 [Vanilla planifolia]